MIDNLLKQEIQTICISHIIAIVFLLVFMLIFVSKTRRDKAVKAFVLMELGIIFWMVFKILKTVSPNVHIRWACVVCYYFFSIMFQLSFLNFTYISYNKKSLPRWAKIILYLGGLIQFLVVLTNPYHYKFYSYFNFKDDGWGVLFLAYTVYSYLIILIGIYYGAKYYNLKLKRRKKVEKYLFGIIIISPIIFHFLYITRKVSGFFRYIGINVWFDITPIVFTITTSLFIYFTFKFDFDEISPLLRSEIVRSLDSAVCVTDSAYKVIYINQKAIDILGDNAANDIQGAINRKHIRTNADDEYEVKLNQKDIMLKIKKIAGVKESEYIITIDDLTYYKKLEKEILSERALEENTNIELKQVISHLKKESKLEARSFVAKELHDIIGHSLVVAIKSLEVAKLYYDKDKLLSKNAIVETYSALDDGIQSMNEMISSKQDYKAVNLKEELINKLERIKSLGIKTHFNFLGENMDLEPELYNVINKVCWELVTNSIKHAKTKDIFLDIRIMAQETIIRFIDNGIGTDNLIEGNGLRGIRERIKSVGGKVTFNTASGEGFLAKIEIVTTG